MTQSLAEVMARRARTLALAHALAPGNGRITARLAEQRFAADPIGERRSSTALLARSALRQDPTAVSAVVTLGLQAQLRNDIGEARHRFAYAERLSRRDFQTQLWAIEDAVARGDVAGALKHYDIALRTTKTAPTVLFPILGQAITNPEIRAALTTTLRGGTGWGPSLIAYLADGTVDPRARAVLFAELRRAGVPLAPEADAAAIRGLLDRAAIDEAWRYYATVRQGVDRRISRDPRFTAGLSTPTPFDWTTSIDGNLTAALQRRGDAGTFDFAVPMGISGVLLQQRQWLPQGAYRLEGRSSGLEQVGRTPPYWTLTCQDGRELGRIDVPISTQAGGAFAGRFVVPATCPIQVLALVARPPENVGGLAGQIDQVRLSPVR